MLPDGRVLSVDDHSRDSAGLMYVYPVVSRRAGGVSVGINLNVNNACNWACIYCQVPGLTRGGPPAIDLERLQRELVEFLKEAIEGDFLVREVPEGMQVLKDVAFSGNGEPTETKEFAAAVEIVEAVLKQFGVADQVKIRLITNGSLLHRAAVRQGIAVIGRLGGEVWFKVDRATPAGIAQINQVSATADKVLRNLERCAALAPTWVQTCWFAVDGKAPDEAEQTAYLELLSRARNLIAGVHLYGLARPSLQPAAPRLSALPTDMLQRFAGRIAEIGVKAIISP